MSFIAAFDSLQLQAGENGTLEYTVTGVQDNLVALFVALVRNIPDDRLTSLLSLCVSDCKQSSWPMEARAMAAADLIVLVFQTRNCRGGKGEKALFHKMIILMHKVYPETIETLLPLIAHYGYFKDYFLILESLATQPQLQDVHSQRLQSAIIDVIVKQLRADYIEATDDSKPHPKLSLCAKYAPRQGSHFASGVNKPWFTQMIQALFSVTSTTTDPDTRFKAMYRKFVSTIAKKLNCVEVKMCDRKFATIEFSSVPSVCNMRNRKAFLNEAVAKRRRGNNGRGHDAAHAGDEEVVDLSMYDLEETGDRYPSNEDRVLCRKHFKEAIANKKVKGGQLHPHEIVTKCYVKSSISEKGLFDAQWSDIRTKVVDRLQALEDDAVEGAVRMDRVISLVDVSGSMAGVPMMVSIALGILTSEIAHPSFRNRVMTFETTPQWIVLEEHMSIYEKVQVVAKMPWGGSTDVDKACQLIADVVKKNRLPEEDIPDLIIYSDMQFNMAAGSSANTYLQRMEKLFAKVGEAICGRPYRVPRIIFWNLRGDTSGFPAQATTKNVQMLSGFSPALLELVLSGKPPPLDKAAATAETTPYDTFRAAVDHKDYYEVREILAQSTESELSHYQFERPVVMEETEQGAATAVAVAAVGSG